MAEAVVEGGAPEQAAWNLYLPPAQRILCFAKGVPHLAAELGARGRHVDVVGFADEVPPALTRTHPVHAYDLVIVWQPSCIDDLRQALTALETHPGCGDVLWLCSRNPWVGGRSSAPTWPHLDRVLKTFGWQRRVAHLGLPDASRVRQIVDWRHYSKTPLLRHARSHRWWKAWLTRQPAYRWRMPVRAVVAERRSQSHSAPLLLVLDQILHDVATTVSEELQLRRLLVSPNGVAIALVDCRAGERAVIKIPYLGRAAARVRTNAAALAWLRRQASLGPWAQVGPRLLGSGEVEGWAWTLEEGVEGSMVQEWKGPAWSGAVSHLMKFLTALQLASPGSFRLDPTTLEELLGQAVRQTGSLLHGDLAQRLQALWQEVRASLDAVRVPLVARHGDFKLENALGVWPRLGSLRVLDWELWTPRGLPLLDAVHLLLSAERRREGISLGAVILRWVRSDDGSFSLQGLEGMASNIDTRYLACLPFLYWLDRVGPVAARGAWPSPAWLRANIEGPLEQLRIQAPGVGVSA